MHLTDFPNELLLQILKEAYPPGAFKKLSDYDFPYDPNGDIKTADAAMVNLSQTCRLFKSLTDKILEMHVKLHWYGNGECSQPGGPTWRNVIQVREILELQHEWRTEVMRLKVRYQRGVI